MQALKERDEKQVGGERGERGGEKRCLEYKEVRSGKRGVEEHTT